MKSWVKQMSKISKCVKRFEYVRVGSDERTTGTDGKLIGEDKRPNIRVFGLKGKETMELMAITDDKGSQEALRFIVLNALQRDDATTTEDDFNEMDMADMISIGNAVGVLSGLGELFDSKKKANGITEEQLVKASSPKRSVEFLKAKMEKERRERI